MALTEADSACSAAGRHHPRRPATREADGQLAVQGRVRSEGLLGDSLRLPICVDMELSEAKGQLTYPKLSGIREWGPREYPVLGSVSVTLS